MPLRNKLSAAAFTLLYVATGFFREFVFVNVNEQIRVTYYKVGDSQLAPSMRFLEGTDYGTLYYSKWILTLVFTLIFAGLAALIVKLLFAEKKFVRLTLLVYAGVFALGILFFGLGLLLGQQEKLYTIARFLAGLVETPAMLIVLIPAFYLARSGEERA